MLPKLEGIIARRVLLNFRVDPDVARGLVPEPLELASRSGYAVAGVCLIRLEQLADHVAVARVHGEHHLHQVLGHRVVMVPEPPTSPELERP
jgi:hypothetical protein